MRFQGWLLDIREGQDSVSLGFKTRDGGNIVLSDRFRHSFYLVSGNPQEAEDYASKHPHVLDAEIEQKYVSLDAKGKTDAIKVVVDYARNYKRVVKDMKIIPGIKEIAETAIPQYFKYVMEKDAAFFSLYDVVAEQGKLISMEKTSSLELPPLSCGAIAPTSVNPKYLNLVLEGKPQMVIHPAKLAEALRETGTDMIFSYGGDSYLKRYGAASSLGNIFGVFFDSCAHIDLRKDIGYDIYNEHNLPIGQDSAKEILGIGKSRIARLIELSQMTGAKPDTICRITPGRLNTYLHIRAAKRNGYLVPDLRKEMERPKSLKLLMQLDKGGSIIYPTPGIYENVAKCDFASMYPNIIVKYNISPETITCTCCKEPMIVPEAGWKTCTERKGIIPQGIEEVLRRRLELKHLAKTSTDPAKRAEFDMRQRALKNILVTCFGYLGFSNFIFSNVECKECVMLYGRHILSMAKEIAEDAGFEALYGMVDSVFVSGGNEKQYLDYVRKVSAETGITLELDCIFSRLVFPAAKDASGVANHYYGLMQDGRMEARGIAVRHSDSCALAVQCQERMAKAILSAPDACAGIKEAKGLLADFKKRLKEGEFVLADFAITKAIGRDIGDYVSNAPHVVAFRQEPNAANVSVFVYSLFGPRPARQASRREIDIKKYAELLDASFEELVRGLRPAITHLKK
ncbi:MAG: DNA polymerase domain-containing protein [Candidatus Micrarchaeia archaeon]